MAFDLEPWKALLAERLQGWRVRMAAAGVSSPEAYLGAVTLWPVVEAYRAGDAPALGILGSVGGASLITHLLDWPDAVEGARRLVATLPEQPDLRAALDAVLRTVGTWELAETPLVPDDRSWSAEALVADPSKPPSRRRNKGSSRATGATARGRASAATGASGVINQGEQQGVIVSGQVFGSIYNIYLSAPERGALSREAFDRTLRDYLETVRRMYGQTRLWGVGVVDRGQTPAVRDLGKVFVPLTLRQFQPLGREEVEMLERQAPEAQARAYLSLAARQRKAGEEVDLDDLLTLRDRLAIIGSAGSGKSTILAYLATTLASAALTGGSPSVTLPRDKSVPVPLVIPLRYFRAYRTASERRRERRNDTHAGTLAGFIPWQLKGPTEFFYRLLKAGGCLLMLDGLDEVVSRDERGFVRQEVEDLVNHVFPGNLAIVTAREAGYRDNAVFGDDFLRLDVQDLDDAQIRVLVENWCAQLYPNEPEQRTIELVSAIHDINNLRVDRELSPLISTPLMTTMVVSVKWGQTELPRERAKLYEACVNVMLAAAYLRDDDVRRELVDWGGSSDDQRTWLNTLALAMHEGGAAGAAVTEERIREVLSQDTDPRISPESLDRFLRAVRHRGGLLEEKAGLFQFVHLTFQEFLAAYSLAKEREAAFPILQPHLTDSWWREVFLLAYGAAQADHRRFAQQYLTWLSSQDGDGEMRLAGLELAGAALLELERANPDRQQTQAEQLALALRDPTLVAPGVLRARAGNTLARLGDPRFRADAWYLPAEPLLGFVEIPGGPFLMGSDKNRDPDAYDDELPQHEIALSRYYLARYPVTVAQFRAFVEASGYDPEDGRALLGLSNHPVVAVSWDEAVAYCTWLGQQLRAWPGTPEPLARLLRQEGWKVTLPSEAEWEKAARGADGQMYPWGDAPDPNRANYVDTGIRATSAVGCFPGGASPYGVEELSGNVWEWTRSLWGESLEVARDVLRVLRGGAFYDVHRLVRCAYRLRNHPDGRDWSVGFRVVVRPCR